MPDLALPGTLRQVLYILAALLGSIGCGSSETILNTPQDGWKTLKAGPAFYLKAPPGSGHSLGQGIDSLVGIFEIPGFDLAYDYGLYSPVLENTGKYQDYTVREVEIDGKKARIIRAYDPGRKTSFPWFSGLYISEVKSASPLGAIKLSIYGWLADPGDYKTSERILETIRFGND